MTRPRNQQVSLASTPYYHCICRCVRRAFLCGKDRYSGQDYEHRRQWVVDRLAVKVGDWADVYSVNIDRSPGLAARYQVIACDMLGFGDSAKPRGHAYSLLQQADLQQALLADLGIREPVHVLAHDYGDSVAQELLARHYEGRFHMASCVFLNGGLFPETHRPVLMQKLLLSPLGWLVARSFGRDDLVSRDALSTQRQQLWLDFAHTGAADLEARLSRLAAWVLMADRLGLDYGLRLPGREIAPDQGPTHQRRCLEALALC